MKKIIIVLMFAVCMVGFAGPAKALSLTAADLIGTVQPGEPASEAKELDRLNLLITMYNTGTPTSPYTYTQGSKSWTYTLDVGSNVPSSLTTANGGLKDEDGSYIITSGYLYLLAKVGDDDVFFYLGGKTGTITSNDIYIPSWITGGTGLSHITLFNPVGVPEPSILILLGTGLLGLVGIGRRK